MEYFQEIMCKPIVRLYWKNISDCVSALKSKYFIAGILSLLCMSQASSHDWAVKTNVLYDATATVNAGLEMQVARNWSVDLSGNINFWSFSGGKHWKHWLVQPEARYWFCQPFGGHFVGAHLIGGLYNFGQIDHGFKFLNNDLGKLADHRYEGWGAGAGIAYGYSWLLGKHWNIEAEIGIGWIYTRYDVYECAGCGRKVERDRVHNYVGPTKAAINLIYVF